MREPTALEVERCGRVADAAEATINKRGPSANREAWNCIARDIINGGYGYGVSEHTRNAVVIAVRAEWTKIQAETAPLSDAEVLRLARIGADAVCIDVRGFDSGPSVLDIGGGWWRTAQIVAQGGSIAGDLNSATEEHAFTAAVRAAMGHKEAIIGTANVTIGDKSFKRVGEIVYDTRPTPAIPSAIAGACESARLFLSQPALDRLPLSDVRQLDEQIAAMERKIEAVKHAQEAEARIAAKREQLARLTAELTRLEAK